MAPCFRCTTLLGLCSRTKAEKRPFRQPPLLGAPSASEATASWRRGGGGRRSVLQRRSGRPYFGCTRKCIQSEATGRQQKGGRSLVGSPREGTCPVRSCASCFPRCPGPPDSAKGGHSRAGAPSPDSSPLSADGESPLQLEDWATAYGLGQIRRPFYSGIVRKAFRAILDPGKGKLNFFPMQHSFKFDCSRSFPFVPCSEAIPPPLTSLVTWQTEAFART